MHHIMQFNSTILCSKLRNQYTARRFILQTVAHIKVANVPTVYILKWNVSSYASVRTGLRIKPGHSIYLLISKIAFLA